MQWPAPAGAVWEEGEPRPELRLSRNHSLGESCVRAFLCSTNNGCNVSERQFDNPSVGVKTHKFPLFQNTPNDNQTPQVGPLNILTNQPGKPNKYTGMPSVSEFFGV